MPADGEAARVLNLPVREATEVSLMLASRGVNKNLLPSALRLILF